MEGGSEMAVSFKELYNANWDKELGAGGMFDPTVLGAKYGNVYEGTMKDYRDLTGAGGGVGGAPTTLRQASNPFTPMPQPTIGYGAGKGAGGGFKGSPGAPDTALPVYDTSKVEALAQRFAAPGIRNLRNTVQNVQQGVYENPNVKRMTLRDALQGYGAGLEGVMAGALKEGAGIYGQEYGPQVQGALQTQRINATERMQSASNASNERIAELNNQWRAWLASQR